VSKTQTCTPTRSSAHEYGGRSSNSIISSDESNPIESGRNRENHTYPSSEVVPPAAHSLTELNSPGVADPGSPISVSPWSAALHQRGGPLFLSNNAPISSQALLPPVQSFDPAPSALNRLAQFSSPTQRPIAFHPPSSFAAVRGAGELARIA
jgi:hypothetical protein